MALTVGGFAPPKTGTLRGRGGNRRRRDNGVSPPLPPRTQTPAPTQTPTPTPTPTPTQVLTAPRRVRRKTRPAALEWQDARLPILGRLWATAWLPSILLAGCLVALVYLLQTSGVATTGYDIQRLQAERDDWQLRNEQLELELAKRESLTWIDSEATGRLGMVRAEPTSLTYVKASN